MPVQENILYLTFDDGPHPTITPFVLDELKKIGAKATFFSIGKNVHQYPEIYKRIMAEGHAVGNHTYRHLNGWKTADEEYFEDIRHAETVINSKLYRPPYGKIRRSQIVEIISPRFGMKVIMWTVLSGDFDEKLSKEQCLDNVINTSEPGAIIVFHDSEKAADRMTYALPKMLEHFKNKGYRFEKLPEKPI